MASENKKTNDKKTPKGATPEDIINGFEQLRFEQRNLASKLSEFELEVNEHRMVIETLKNIDENRTCYRLIGGILTERKVKDVLPVLIEHKERLTELIEKLNEQLTKKGTEINEYKDKHNIRIRGQEDLKQQDECSDTSNSNTTTENRGNVLVS